MSLKRFIQLHIKQSRSSQPPQLAPGKRSGKDLNRCALICMILAASFLTPLMAAELPTRDEERGVNDDTVGIVFHYEDVYHTYVEDMVREFGKTSDVRLVPIIGEHHVQTIYDMLYLNGIDLGIVHSDVFEYMSRQQNFPQVYDRISNLVELFSENIAIIAGDKYQTLADLKGQKVNFRALGKGSDLAGTLIFGTLGIAVEPTRFNKYEALEKVKSGEIAAMVYTMEEPAQPFTSLSVEDGVRVLGVPQDQALLKFYKPATITTNFFPQLMAESGPIPSVSVSIIVAAYNWNQSNAWRYEKSKRFTDAMVNGLNNLKNGPNGELWKDVSFETDVPSVKRLGMIETIIGERKAQQDRELAESESLRQAQLLEKRAELIEKLATGLDDRLTDSDELAELESLIEQLQLILDNNL